DFGAWVDRIAKHLISPRVGNGQEFAGGIYRERCSVGGNRIRRSGDCGQRTGETIDFEPGNMVVVFTDVDKSARRIDRHRSRIRLSRDAAVIRTALELRSAPQTESTEGPCGSPVLGE